MEVKSIGRGVQVNIGIGAGLIALIFAPLASRVLESRAADVRTRTPEAESTAEAVKA